MPSGLSFGGMVEVKRHVSSSSVNWKTYQSAPGARRSTAARTCRCVWSTWIMRALRPSSQLERTTSRSSMAAMRNARRSAGAVSAATSPSRSGARARRRERWRSPSGQPGAGSSAEEPRSARRPWHRRALPESWARREPRPLRGPRREPESRPYGPRSRRRLRGRAPRGSAERPEAPRVRPEAGRRPRREGSGENRGW